MKKLFGMLLVGATVLCSGCYHELKANYELRRNVDDIMKIQPVLSNMVNRIQSKNMTVIQILILGNEDHSKYSIYVAGRDNDDFVEERD